MNRIKFLREEKNIFQKDLAKLLGVSVPAINYYENEKRAIDTKTASILADYFNCSIDYLLGKSNYRNKADLGYEQMLYTEIFNQYKDEFSKIKLTPNETTFYNKIVSSIPLDIFNDNTDEKEISSYINSNYFKDKTEFSQSSKDKIIKKAILFIEYTMEIKEFSNIIDKNITGLTKKTESTAVVFVYGTIPAGVPMEMIEDVLDTEEIDVDMLKGGKQYFGLRIKGNSMSPDYRDGDTIILEKVENCENGQDCVVMVNGNDGTFKRVFKNENGIILQPLNSEYQPMIYSNEQIDKMPIKIIGKVVELRRKF